MHIQRQFIELIGRSAVILSLLIVTEMTDAGGEARLATFSPPLDDSQPGVDDLRSGPRFGANPYGTGAGGGGASSTQDFEPVFTQTPRNITVGPGDRAVLACRVENLGTRTVTWKRLDEIHPLTIGVFAFAPDPRISVDYNQRKNEWTLIIHDIRPSDEGIYQCQISTKNDHDSYDIMLHVSTVQMSGTDYVERGGTIQLVCNASGRPDPPHDIEWFKDSEPIRSDSVSGILIAKKIETHFLVSVLKIFNSRLSDAGLYVCWTSNGESSSVGVHVLSVPASVEKRGTLVEKMTSSGAAGLHFVHRRSSVTVMTSLLNITVFRNFSMSLLSFVTVCCCLR